MQTNLKNLLKEAGVEDLRPSNSALTKMRISRRRFTQLLENVNKTPIAVHEMNAIKEWIDGISVIKSENLMIGSN